MTYHDPVLVAEVLNYMRLQPDNIYADCTAGGGGHLLHMLNASPESRFIGIDWDPEAITHARETLIQYQTRCTLIQGNFATLGLILNKLGIEQVNGVLIDCGVSYHQVTTPARGFSYDLDGPLLMRMSPDVPALHEKLRFVSERELAMLLRSYGDVRNYRKIARLLYSQRTSITTTMDLRSIVDRATPKRYQRKNRRRVFQALRIWVNDELNNLSIGLSEAMQYLQIGGRMITIAYHSGEDRIIKHFFRACHKQKKAVLLTKRIIRPSEDEIQANPRARSARLRAIEKCG